MATRGYICESCFNTMRMTDKEYTEQSKNGRLVYCRWCKPAFPPRKIAGVRVMNA